MIELHIEPLVDGVAANITCRVGEANESEQRKLQRVLASFPVPVPVLNSIQDFEGYYRSVMCEMVGADIDADPDQYRCRITLPGTVDDIQETNGEIVAG